MNSIAAILDQRSFLGTLLVVLFSFALLASFAGVAQASACWGSGCQYYDYDNKKDYYSGNYYYGHSNYAYSDVYYPGYGYRYPEPSCSITLEVTGASPFGGSSSFYQHNAMLRWSSSYATSAHISPDVGSVATNGVQAIYLQNARYYTLTVYGPGGSYTCRTENVYASPYSYYHYPKYTYPSVTYPTYTYTAAVAPVYTSATVYTASATKAPAVKLSQMPYTGVSFGVWGDALAWLLVTLSATVGAGAIVYSRRREVSELLARIRRS